MDSAVSARFAHSRGGRYSDYGMDCRWARSGEVFLLSVSRIERGKRVSVSWQLKRAR